MNLLNTIKIPRGNIRQLNSQLPKKNYEVRQEELKEEDNEDEDFAREDKPTPAFIQPPTHISQIRQSQIKEGKKHEVV